MTTSAALQAGKAFRSCSIIVKKYDYPNFLASILIKDKQSQRAVFAVHAFNNAIASVLISSNFNIILCIIKLFQFNIWAIFWILLSIRFEYEIIECKLQIPNQARDLKTRQLRFQFWLDALNQVYANPNFVPESLSPDAASASKSAAQSSSSSATADPQATPKRPLEPADVPIAVALQTPVLSELHWAVHKFGITRKWLARVISARRVLVEHTGPISQSLAPSHPLNGLMVCALVIYIILY